jgi:hypothetical protein
MPEIVGFPTRDRSSIEKVLLDTLQNHDKYLAIAVIGYDADEKTFYVPSDMLRAELIALLSETLADVIADRS